MCGGNIDPLTLLNNAQMNAQFVWSGKISLKHDLSIIVCDLSVISWLWHSQYLLVEQLWPSYQFIMAWRWLVKSYLAQNQTIYFWLWFRFVTCMVTCFFFIKLNLPVYICVLSILYKLVFILLIYWLVCLRKYLNRLYYPLFTTEQDILYRLSYPLKLFT